MSGREQRRQFRRTPRDERGSAMHKLASVVVALLLAAGVAAQQGWIPDLSRDASGPPPANRTEPPASGPRLELAEPAAAPSVLDPARTRGAIRGRALADLLDKAVKDKDLGKHLGLVVELLGSSRPAYRLGGRDVTPASTLKLLTTVAALHAMGPDHRFSTEVVAGATKRSIVLVGGGDPLLTGATPSSAEARTAYPERASLQDLARQTARALKRHGVRVVSLAYDVSLFSGPTVNPHWEPSYVPDDVVSPIVPLWVDEGREVDGYSARAADPALEAARLFATLLSTAGVKVVGTPQQHAARPSAREIAAVNSAPLAEIVEHVLELSDNEGAETLLRQTAIATGKPGSFKAGVRAVEQQLGDLALNVDTLRLFDGSGLSRQDSVPVKSITAVLQIAARPDNPELRSVVTSLPVAGFTGSLAYRFIDDAPQGLGVVRAKTGTLSRVHGLAGTVVTQRGTPLVFAAIADRVPLPKTLDARAQLDEIAALLATCEC